MRCLRVEKQDTSVANASELQSQNHSFQSTKQSRKNSNDIQTKTKDTVTSFDYSMHIRSNLSLVFVKPCAFFKVVFISFGTVVQVPSFLLMFLLLSNVEISSLIEKHCDPIAHYTSLLSKRSITCIQHKLILYSVPTEYIFLLIFPIMQWPPTNLYKLRELVYSKGQCLPKNHS